VIDQISKQLGKLVDVVNIVDMTDGDHIERELALFKLHIKPAERDKLERLVGDTGARILDDHEGHFTVELIGGGQDIDRFLNKVSRLAEILTVVRSGAMAVARGLPVLAPT
ncbi:MAG TPA: acetolactate synthase small subunit, partial [Gammaproteobacteria bacterium]|nr:acetolactate synthase small subunit [Gammaproteobacteria bacterium]